jgi:hypothetical protein
MDFLDNAVLAVVPKKGFFDLLTNTMEAEEIDTDGLEKSFDKIDVYTNCPLYLIPPFEDTEQFNDFIKRHYEDLLKHSISRFIPDQRYWPKELTFELFNDYFDIEYHSRIFNLSSQG